MGAIIAFRVHDPLLLFLVLSLLLTALLYLSRGWTHSVVKDLKYFAKLFSIVKVGLIAIIWGYVALVLSYIFSNTFFDQAEPNVAAVSWLFKSGYPLFPTMDAAERYINNYGAFLYIINRFFLTLFGPEIISVKLGCGLAAILSVGLIFLSVRKVATHLISLLATAYAALALLSITNSFAFHAASFWLRPDPLLIFFVSAALLSVISGNRTIATGVTAIAFGCSLNLKINAFVNFLPIYALLLGRFGWTAVAVSSVGAIVTAALPFLLSPQISLSNYLIWLSQSRHKATSFQQLFEVSKWVFYILLPVFLSLGYLFCRSRSSFRQFIYKYQVFIYTLLGCIIASLAFSHKIGVLENNHLPLILLFAYLLALILEWVKSEHTTLPINSSTQWVQVSFVSAALALIITMPLAIAPEVGRLVSTLIKAPSNPIIADMRQVMKSYPSTTIGMGFSEGGGNYERTYYRPLLVFAGNPYLVDAVVMFEMQASGVNPISDATLQALETCQTQLWLMPKVTQQPFDLKNFYPPHAVVFSEAFRSRFLQRYERVGESRFFEQWVCKTKAS